MKQKNIKNLINAYPNLTMHKISSNDFLLLDSTSTLEIYKGVKISNFRFSTSISIWMTPIICFPSSDLIVFDNYELLSERGRQELSLNNDLYSDDAILERFDEALRLNLPELESVQTFEELEKFLFSNEGQWLVSIFSKAQYALLSYYMGHKAKALSLLSTVYGNLNSHNPLTRDVKVCMDILKSNDSVKIDEYFNFLKQSNSSKFKEKFVGLN